MPRWPERVPPHAERPAQPPRPGEAQLWLVRVPPADVGLDALLAGLSPAERERGRAKRIESKRREYVTGQAVLRTLLGRALNVDPLAVAFEVFHRGLKAK